MMAEPRELPIATYLIVIGKTAKGYSAHSPDVPGCGTIGKTVEDVVANMKDALEFHFEGITEDGDLIPKPQGIHAYEEVMTEEDADQYLLAHVVIDTSRFGAPGGRLG